MSADPDAATVEVVRNYLSSAAKEMERTLVRTAYSTLIYEIKDFGLSLYDADLNLVADSTGLPLFLGANDFGVVNALDRVDVDELEPGDVIALNIPYETGTHPNDTLLVAPVFYETAIVGYGALRAHWTDIGGKDPGYILDSTSVHQEGLLLPGVKLVEGGEFNGLLVELLRTNSRAPETLMGDIQAEIAALRTGQDRFRSLCDKYGPATVEACIDRFLDHGETMAREEVAALPDGTWMGENTMDNDGITEEPIPIRAEVTIDGEAFHVDFSESADVVEGPVNLALGMTESACKFCFKSVTTPDEPSNAGHFEPVSVTAPEGNLFNATPPAATFTIWAGVLAIDAIYHALSKGIPERVPASSGGDLGDPGFYGREPYTGRQVWHQTNAGVGWGATEDHDGLNATQHMSMNNVKNIPVEVVENRLPVLVERSTLNRDSGGPGRHRGGLGSRRDYLFLDSFGALVIIKKSRTDGWGIAGGESGSKNVGILYPNTDEDDWREDWESRVTIYADNDDIHGNDDPETTYAGMFRGQFEAGERISYFAGGGGGYGDPHERPPERVRDDVLDGYVSREAAREKYGVAVTEDGEIDLETTDQLRHTDGND